MSDTTPASAAAPESATTPASEKMPSALSVPNFRLLLGANLTFFLVGNALRFAFGWVVLDFFQRSEGWQGLIAFTLGIPSLFLMMHAGVWADRYDRRMIMLMSQIGSFIVIAATAVLVTTDQLTMGWLIAVSVLAGIFQTISQPVRASLVPSLVAPEQLFSAIAANAIVMTITLITGPVVAKLIGDQFGFDGTFAGLAGVLVIGVAFLLRLSIPAHEAAPPKPGQDESDTTSTTTDAEAEQPSVRAQLAEAFDHVNSFPALRKLFLLLIVSGLTINAAVMVTMQAFVSENLGRDAGDAAPLFAVMGLGIAISSGFVMKKGNVAQKGLKFQRAMLVGSTAVILMGQAPSYAAMFPLVLIMGLAGGFYINMNQGLIQTNTPQHLMGRVMGLFSLVSTGLLPIGALVLGFLAEIVGVGTVMSGAALCSLTYVLYTYLTDKDLRALA